MRVGWGTDLAALLLGTVQPSKTRVNSERRRECPRETEQRWGDHSKEGSLGGMRSSCAPYFLLTEVRKRPALLGEPFYFVLLWDSGYKRAQATSLPSAKRPSKMGGL